MAKNKLEFEGLTEDQISEIQSLADTFRKENEKKNYHFSVEDPDDAFNVYMVNAKPVHYRDVWHAAIEWHENKVVGDLKECLR